jgi:tetratricopeptide (TPR) repeat protein
MGQDMTAQSPSLSLELVPMDTAPAEKKAAPAAESIEITAVERVHLPAAAPEVKTDRFVREAAQQYAEGHIDQPLWDRAFAQANGDRLAAADIYLAARATALRLLDRERRTERRILVPDAQPAIAAAAADTDADAGLARTVVQSSGSFHRRRLLAKYRPAIIAAAVILPLAIGGWLLLGLLSSGGDVTPAARAPAVKPSPAAAIPPAAVAAVEAPKPDPAVELMRKIQEFRDAGNWNMLVLYAVEWTRREPSNAVAWNQLRAGYLNLRQLDDAQGAARKAVEFAPKDASMWRNLAEVTLDLDDVSGAVLAYEQAAALDPQDLHSLRQIGVLTARQGCLPESRIAFERALALSPNDPTTLQMRAAATQPAAPKEKYSAARQIAPPAPDCRGTIEPVAPAPK